MASLRKGFTREYATGNILGAKGTKKGNNSIYKIHENNKVFITLNQKGIFELLSDTLTYKI